MKKLHIVFTFLLSCLFLIQTSSAQTVRELSEEFLQTEVCDWQEFFNQYPDTSRFVISVLIDRYVEASESNDFFEVVLSLSNNTCEISTAYYPNPDAHFNVND